MNVLSNATLHNLKSIEFESELKRILDYWSDVVFDDTSLRFYPKVDHTDKPHPNSTAGSVMYARILWAFSAGYHHTRTHRYLEMANIAYQYIRQHFIDPEYGGVYWSVYPDGGAADNRKQIYALAFTIYGLAEYYKIQDDDGILEIAKKLYDVIEQHSWDTDREGYIEAFGRDWTPTTQLKLSEKDDNEKKTLNTHLHLLEAYTNLYTIWPNNTLKQRIETLLELFEKHFVNQQGHLILFFNEHWQAKSSPLRSFGHEIETSWLLCEASHAINGTRIADTIRTLSLRLAAASLKWVDTSGALHYEFNPATNKLVAEKHWWVQAEAVVGFYRIGILSGNRRYLTTASQAWQYIKGYLIDQQRGEWYWGRDQNGRIMDREDKAGFWKCPYHNSRCCLQMIHLLGQ